jgi:hypothetical protein
MLRRNPETGKMERKQTDGSWVEIPVEEVRKIGDVEVTLPVAQDDSGVVVQAEEPGQRAPKPAEETGNTVGDTQEMPDLGALFVDTTPVQPEVSSVPEAPAQLSEPAQSSEANGDAGDMDFEVPGLTTGDGKKGSGGQKSVLQKLQDRARSRVRVTRPNGAGAGSGDGGGGRRTPVKLEVAERAAVATGPAVRDTTEARTRSRTVGGGSRVSGNGTSRAVGTKPAPGILADQPKWVTDLFEAHFRSSRTGELRRKPSGPARADGSVPDRMKMSREDFAIGWLVMLEAARRDPEILRLGGGKKGRSSLSGVEDQITSPA